MLTNASHFTLFYPSNIPGSEAEACLVKHAYHLCLVFCWKVTWDYAVRINLFHGSVLQAVDLTESSDHLIQYSHITYVKSKRLTSCLIILIYGKHTELPNASHVHILGIIIIL